jgi:hypothetical protein
MDVNWIRHETPPRRQMASPKVKKRSFKPYRILIPLFAAIVAPFIPGNLEQKIEEDPIPAESPLHIAHSNPIYTGAFQDASDKELENSFNRDAWTHRLSRTSRFRDYINQTRNPELVRAIIVHESYGEHRAEGPTNDLGLGMFIPETAARHGLKVETFIDERVDPEKSITAIDNRIEYLKGIYGDDHVKIMVTYTKGANFQKKELQNLEGQALLDHLKGEGIDYHLKVGRFIPMEETLDYETMPLHSATQLVEVHIEDSLWRTANRYGISIDTVLEYNALASPSRYPPGLKIKIPAKNKSAE